MRTAAIELSLEYGYDNVTVAQIADRAGLNRRTFSRYFTDRRDVLFAGSEQIPGLLADALGRADPDLTPFEALIAALTDVGSLVGSWVGPLAAPRREVIASSPELQERERTKFADVAAALAGGVRHRGSDTTAAGLLADVAGAIFQDSFDRWLNRPTTELATHLRQASTDLAKAVGNRGQPG